MLQGSHERTGHICIFSLFVEYILVLKSLGEKIDILLDLLELRDVGESLLYVKGWPYPPLLKPLTLIPRTVPYHEPQTMQVGTGMSAKQQHGDYSQNSS